ncbi:RrF2 family transcriptional regulator [Chloroflexota bacterium]
MKFSTRGRYSTRAMLDLACHGDNGPVLIKDIARRQDLSERYLEQLFIPLRVAGLIKGIRGAKGGFKLIKPPQEIKLREIVQATEGVITTSDCVHKPGICPRSDTCVVRNIWAEMQRAIDNVLESFTLEDLVDQQRERLSQEDGSGQKN